MKQFKPKEIYRRKPTGQMLPCTGDAHSNPYIDNCMICAPRWGEVPAYHPADIIEAMKSKLPVPLWMLSEDQRESVDTDLIPAGKAAIEMIEVTTGKKRSGSTSFFAVVWL